MKQNIEIVFILSPASSHLQPLQVENCDSNSQLVVDESDNGSFTFERVELLISYISHFCFFFNMYKKKGKINKYFE